MQQLKQNIPSEIVQFGYLRTEASHIRTFNPLGYIFSRKKVPGTYPYPHGIWVVLSFEVLFHQLKPGRQMICVTHSFVESWCSPILQIPMS